jgi:hypothetical protein
MKRAVRRVVTWARRASEQQDYGFSTLLAITEFALNNGETLHSQAGSVLLAEMVRSPF